MEKVKVVVIGQGLTGQTALLKRYTKNEICELPFPTVFDYYTTTLRVDGEPLEIQFTDISGQDMFEQVRPLHYPGADACLISFGINSSESFKSISDVWYPEVSNYIPNIPLTLVGCKSDLSECRSPHEKFVPRADAEHLAEKINAVYCETSAFTGLGINECMEATVLAVLARRKALGATKKGIGRFFKSKSKVKDAAPVIEHPFNFPMEAALPKADSAGVNATHAKQV